MGVNEMGGNGSALPPVLRRADDIVLRVIGADAFVERRAIPVLCLPGQAQRLGFLWDLLDAPRTARELVAALDETAIELLVQMIEAGALLPWPLTTHLTRLHQATVAPSTMVAVGAGLEDARLLRENAAEDGLDLPVPTLRADLAAALGTRRTVRDFTGASLSLADLSTLLAFGAGSPIGPALPSVVGGPPGVRTYPSGGGLYPVEILGRPILVDSLEPIYYRYQVLAHRLVHASRIRVAPSVIECMLVENRVVGASVVILLWVDFTRPSLGKYGEKAYRLALLEAGHIAQNLLLIAAGLELAGVPLCGFDDQALAAEAGLIYPEQPIVYVVALGGAPSLRSRP
jgi:SagB-type dehydrogenase family enzyme